MKTADPPSDASGRKKLPVKRIIAGLVLVGVMIVTWRQPEMDSNSGLQDGVLSGELDPAESIELLASPTPTPRRDRLPDTVP